MFGTVVITAGEGPKIPDYAALESRCGGNPRAARLFGHDAEYSQVTWEVQLPWSDRSEVQIYNDRVFYMTRAGFGLSASAI